MNQICVKLFGIEMLEDIRRYKQIRNKGLLSLFLMYPEFRYQVLYRLRLRSSFLKYILMPLKIHNSHCLWISCKNIGGAFLLNMVFLP